MNWKISIFLLLSIVSACKQKATDNLVHTTPTSVYLINADELKYLALVPSNKIVDFRKNEEYAHGHITGAINIWRTDIEDTSYAYNGIMANPSQLEMLFSNLGINTDNTLIIYDDNGLCDASRLWWILQNYGFTDVKMVQGGLSAWKTRGGEISTETPLVKKTEFKFKNEPSMHLYASKEDVQAAINTTIVILDTRSKDEFIGKTQKEDAFKAGRIPNSILIDWAEAIDYNGNKQFKSTEELEAIYAKLNVSKEDPIIVYCHSGVRSAHTSFVLTQLLEYNNVKNYDGSWTEWSFHKDLLYTNDN